MFQNLSERLQGVLRNLRGQARITEATLQESLRQVRLALLEADVNVAVVQKLINAVREKALGEEVLRSLTPGQQVVAIVRDELAGLLGSGEDASLRTAPRPPTIILMVGLQGSGKTTTTAKLGLWLKRQGRFPYLIPADVQRPAAIEQLIRVGRAAELPVFEHDGREPARKVALAGLAHALKSGFDTVLVDTAGRLHIDTELMQELTALRDDLRPHEILFVADAMTGQDAVRSAREFHAALNVTGVVLTKLDGDARGGAALSIRHVAGVPIKFIGTGERTQDLEAFHADRMVGRILGMGDVLGLIERAQESVDEDEAKRLERKLLKSEFNLEDFRDQLRMLRRMGPLQNLMAMIPGMSQVKDADLDPKALTRVVAIIDAMTPGERRTPRILDGSRKRRISRGSGQSVPEINRLLKQFAQMQRMMKSVRAAAKKGKRPRLPFFGR